MSATVVVPAPPWDPTAAEPSADVIRVALLGTGAVGSAFLRRLGEHPTLAGCRPTVVHAANSRRAASAPEGLDAGAAVERVARSDRASHLDDVEPALRAGDGTRVVVDATASAEVALRHPYWLERGLHVVTACKIAAGGPLSQSWRLAGAAQRGGTSYGDSATVGAGLPILRTIRDLRRGGDQVLGLAGVLSGSLAWLLGRYDGTRPVSELVDEAKALGYLEPDPRDDLSGEDVRRKLLILTRAAGASLEPADIAVQPLLPAAEVPGGGAALGFLDVELADRLRAARGDGRVLRYVARWDPGVARVGLEDLAADDPLAPAGGCDNRVAIWSTRYRESPLVLQGPGAGPGVTAAALLDDVLRIARD